MIEDSGTIKAVLPATAQNSPTALRRPTEADAAKNAVRQPVETQAEKEQPQPLENVVQELNHLVRELHRELHFTVDNESGDTVIKGVDRETDEVVRHIPSEEVMRLRERLQEAAGVIFRDSA